MQLESRKRNDGSSTSFWANAGRQLLRNTLRVLTCGRPTVSIREMFRFIVEAPSSRDVVTHESWRLTEFFGPCLEEALRVTRGGPFQQMVVDAQKYWMSDFAELAPVTRSGVVTGLTALADGLFDPAIHKLLCHDTTLTPEATLEGTIILIDLPLKEYDSLGLFVQGVWKYLFQKCVERRRDPADARRRPVFLWVDEAQFFCTEYDGLFQSTARSARCATVYLTQNISNVYGLMGGSQAHDSVNGLLGNLNTKIAHANNDPNTNLWMAEQIGKSLQYLANASTTHSGPTGFDFGNRPGPQRSTTASVQQHIDFDVQPSVFHSLRTGGERHGGLVDAVFVKSGTTFRASGKHYFFTVFNQELR